MVYLNVLDQILQELLLVEILRKVEAELFRILLHAARALNEVFFVLLDN